MNSIATTIEQSRRLLELGLSKSTASMLWYDVNQKPQLDIGHTTFSDDMPAWTFIDLLEILPKTLDEQYGLYFSFINNDIQLCYFDDKFEVLHQEVNTYLEAAYNMVVWLLENNYIKK